MNIRRAGSSALLIECRDGAHVEAWRVELWRRREAGELAVVDIVPGARTVLLDGVAPGTASLLGTWAPEENAASLSDSPLVEIPTAFDGEDLDDVAARWGSRGTAPWHGSRTPS